jgi:hypothetical protein
MEETAERGPQWTGLPVANGGEEGLVLRGFSATITGHSVKDRGEGE